MAQLDRTAVIDLLGRLGAEDDETALKAARDLHRIVTGSGLSWGEIVRAELDGPSADAPVETRDKAVADEAETDGVPSDTDKNQTIRLLDRLLARKTLSDLLREDLVEIKRSISEGSFDAMDSRYIRALAKRLGA